MKHILETEFLTVNDVSLVPQAGVVPSRKDVEITPFIYSAPMDTVTGYEMAKALLEANEFPVVSRFISIDEQWKILQEFIGHPNLFFAVGIGKDIQRLLNLFADVCAANEGEEQFEDPKFNIALDVAHGDMLGAHEAAAFLRTQPFIDKIMSGSICTPDAAERAVKSGCTHLRVGVGPGAACTTRLKTGVGIPNLSAVYLIDQNDIAI